ncbi:UNVERIFIED_CONTAM: hypothetical protein GTU68_034124, partial [Idotea baltica]|nr:hypothetical protein [Idotea baltica]
MLESSGPGGNPAERPPQHPHMLQTKTPQTISSIASQGPNSMSQVSHSLTNQGNMMINVVNSKQSSMQAQNSVMNKSNVQISISSLNMSDSMNPNMPSSQSSSTGGPPGTIALSNSLPPSSMSLTNTMPNTSLGLTSIGNNSGIPVGNMSVGSMAPGISVVSSMNTVNSMNKHQVTMASMNMNNIVGPMGPQMDGMQNGPLTGMNRTMVPSSLRGPSQTLGGGPQNLGPRHTIGPNQLGPRLQGGPGNMNPALSGNYNFANVQGSIDGSHSGIQSPSTLGHTQRPVGMGLPPRYPNQDMNIISNMNRGGQGTAPGPQALSGGPPNNMSGHPTN